MQKIYMLFWVGIRLPAEVEGKIRSVQKALSKKYNTCRCVSSQIGPHVTVTFQPNVDSKDIKSIEKAVTEVLNETAPMTVKVSGVGKFDSDRVIYARVLKTKGIMNLNKNLKAKLSKFGNVMYDDFNPHVSLARKDISPEAFNAAFSEMRGKKLSFSFRAERISIGKSRADGRIRVYRTIPMKV
jgi:2'-5' RNA ligase